MKRWGPLFFLVVSSYLASSAVFAEKEVPKLVPNSRSTNKTTEFYLTSGLSVEERREVLGLMPIVTRPDERMMAPNGRLLYSYDIFPNIAKKVVSIIAVNPGEPWKNLAEKRYSYLRDLFRSLDIASNANWRAFDYKLDDGTYVFSSGYDDLLVVRASDGGLFRGRFDSSNHNFKSFEDIVWFRPPKRWDDPSPLAPCLREISRLKEVIKFHLNL